MQNSEKDEANFQDNDIEMFHNERNVIITMLREVRSGDVEKYLMENLEKFPNESHFMIFTAHHHPEKGRLGETDYGLVGDYEAVMNRIKKDCNR